MSDRSCTYGGACPGRMGAGLYLAYPAFYTDVTDSYRLSRGGRLRTDLAGVYFNVLFVLGTAGIYALTGVEALLVVIVVQHLEMAHQLLPVIRLDGYYIVADLVGVPDLFSRIKPILLSLLPWRQHDPQVAALRWWARAVVTLWTLVTVPLLLFQLFVILLHLPRIVGTALDAMSTQWAALGSAVADGRWVPAAASGVQALVILLPMVGLALVLVRIGFRALRFGWTRTDGHPVLRVAFVALSAAAVGTLVYTWLPNGDYQPIRRGEKGTIAESVRAVRRVPGGRPAMVPAERTTASTTTTSTTIDDTTTTTTTDGVETTTTTDGADGSTGTNGSPATSSTVTTAEPRTATTTSSTEEVP